MDGIPDTKYVEIIRRYSEANFIDDTIIIDFEGYKDLQITYSIEVTYGFVDLSWCYKDEWGYYYDIDEVLYLDTADSDSIQYKVKSKYLKIRINKPDLLNNEELELFIYATK